MKTLNNSNFYFGSDKFKLGNKLSEIGILEIYDSIQPVVYYESGLDVIDDIFWPDWYIKKGIVPSILSFENSLSFFFLKYNRATVVDLTVAHILRKSLLKFEKFPAKDLEVVKREATKHNGKYMAKRGFGLIGSLVSFATDKVIIVNTEIVTGWRYKLYFLDNFNQEKIITIYASNEFSNDLDLFLNKNFKALL